MSREKPFFSPCKKAFLGLTVAIGVNTTVVAAPAVESYVVVLEKQAGSPSRIAAEVATRNGGKVGYVYSNVINGFSISLPAAAAERMKADKRIRVLSPDVVMSANELPTGHQLIGVELLTYGAASELLINELDDFRVAAKVAVLDTGIDHTHTLLNVVESVDCMVKTSKGPAWSANYTCESGTGRGMDGNGHGTHVAGTIGALDQIVSTTSGSYHLPGVATGVDLVAVKVLDDQGSGYLSTILAGLDWVASDDSIHVVNMSLGGGSSSLSALTAYEEAINPLVENGVQVVVAAGNETELLDADDGYYRIPAEVESAITVAALSVDGASQASFSNYGEVVDLYAPGSDVLSTYPNSGLAIMSGTSMATPYVAGAVALLAASPDGFTGLGRITSGELNGKPKLSVLNVNTTAVEPTTVTEPETGGGGDGGTTTTPTKGRGKKK